MFTIWDRSDQYFIYYPNWNHVLFCCWMEDYCDCTFNLACSRAPTPVKTLQTQPEQAFSVSWLSRPAQVVSKFTLSLVHCFVYNRHSVVYSVVYCAGHTTFFVPLEESLRALLCKAEGKVIKCCMYCSEYGVTAHTGLIAAAELTGDVNQAQAPISQKWEHLYGRAVGVRCL